MFIFMKKNAKFFYLILFITLSFIVNHLAHEVNLQKVIKASFQYHPNNTYRENSLVHITDTITSTGFVNDNGYISNLDNIIVLKKTVEMYLWTSHFNKSGPSYHKGWEYTYTDSNDFSFLNSQLYKNPKQTKKLGTFFYYPSSVKLGEIEIPIHSFQADKYTQVKLNISIKNKRNLFYIFLGKGTLTEPSLGDIRIRYQVYQSNQLTTIFGTIVNQKISFSDNNNLTSFFGKKVFQRVYKGSIDNVITSFIKNEEGWKVIINYLLAIFMFFPIFKLVIVSYNMSLKQNIQSNIKRYSVLFLLILPISIGLTYLIVKSLLFGLQYF